MKRALLCFECSVPGAPWNHLSVKVHTVDVYAHTRGAAKADYWRRLRECWDGLPFTAVRARRVLRFPEDPNLASVCRYRGIPSLRAGLSVVRLGEDFATVVGAGSSANIKVIFDSGRTSYAHPDDLVVVSL